MTKQIYCGDEYTAAFLENALTELLEKVECETFTIDGEYFLEVTL